MVAALALEIEHGINQMLDRAGTGNLAILGHMPDQQQRRPRCLGVAHQIEGGGAHLCNGAGRSVERRGPDRLDGIDGEYTGRRCAFQRGQNIFDTGGRAQLDRRFGQPHPGGTQTHLRHRLFTGNIDGRTATACEGRQRLQDQGGFAHPRIAADQKRRARHQTATADPVEFADTAGPAGGCPLFRLQVFQRERPPPRARLGTGTGRDSGGFLHNRVPSAAGIATAGPFGVNRAAGLTDKGDLRHDVSVRPCRDAVSQAATTGGFSPLAIRSRQCCTQRYRAAFHPA